MLPIVCVIDGNWLPDAYIEAEALFVVEGLFNKESVAPGLDDILVVIDVYSVIVFIGVGVAAAVGETVYVIPDSVADVDTEVVGDIVHILAVADKE